MISRCRLPVLVLVLIPWIARADGLASSGSTACLTPEVQAMLGRIAPDSLRGHLSFLASDLLEGRGTPSRGLDLAAEYIAAQFRRAGLEPLGDDGYFQTARWRQVVASAEEPAAEIPDGDELVRNVAGLLRGSDPKLRDTYVLVTAHYDHLGIRPNLEGDRIFNGANDDGSGTVTVIELAEALAGLKPRPRRSLVFLAFCGEEHGLLGSKYYARHPLVPIEQTVADINIEQVGRTDDSEGPRVAAATVTGFDYSSLGATLRAAGQAVGVQVEKHPQFSDGYFGASDNRPLADLGIPAHTVSVAYQFPDYHAASDHWEKVDYANMARVDRMIALGLLRIANDPEPPRWDESNPKVAPFARAARARAEIPSK